MNKFNELFGGGRISNAILNDLNKGHIRDFISSKDHRYVAVSSSKEDEICKDFTDAVDFILDRSKVNKLGNIKNLDDYHVIELESFADEYGYEKVYIGYEKEKSERKGLCIFVSTKKRFFIRSLFSNPVYLAGIIVRIKNKN